MAAMLAQYAQAIEQYAAAAAAGQLDEASAAQYQQLCIEYESLLAQYQQYAQQG
jgi:hypothetical protein